MLCSSKISVDGRLAMLRVDGGYIDGDGSMHYYVTDYQGNITRIFDTPKLRNTIIGIIILRGNE